MKSAAIISKPSKPELAGILPELLAWFRKRGYTLYLDQETAQYTNGEEVVPRKAMGAKHPDFALVLGGDGTLLVGGARPGPRRRSHPGSQSRLARIPYRSATQRDVHHAGGGR